MHLKWTLRSSALLGALAIGLAALSACGGSDSAKADGSQGGSAAGGEPVTIAVTMTDNVFTPKEITVKAGQPVTFVVKNTGQAIHNMHILSKGSEGKDFQSEPIINPGSESTFTATFSKKGKVKFQCDLHLPDMAGTITVQ